MNTELNKDDGFFKQKHIFFCKSLSQNDLNYFSSLSNNVDRFKFVYELTQTNDYPFHSSFPHKSEFEAKICREEGNKYFQFGDFPKALNSYSKALLKIPRDREEDTAIIRANRSAALYHLGLFNPALKEIDNALCLGYPEDIAYKIKDRKARCFLALKQHKSAIEAFRETLQALDRSKLKLEKRQKWQRDVQIMVAMITNSNPENAFEMDSTTGESTDNFKTTERNPKFIAAHKYVSISFQKDMGRFAEANNNIGIGDVILSEEPHCSFLLEEKISTHCFHCFKRLIISEPCVTCSNIGFCSKECSSIAMKTYHKYECSILPVLWASGASITCLMALRIITQNPLSFFKQLMSEGNPKCSGTYKGCDYNTLYNLVTHEEKREVADFLHRAHMAVFLVKCLEKSGYFSSEDGEAQNEAIKNFVGGLILRHLQILQFNAHEVSELEVEDGDLEKTRSIFLGGAVYPTLALFNHSCNPSLTRYFQGTRVIARAIRNIKKGECIAENYGPIFTETTKTVRQHTLKTQYWFNCACEACEKNWPLIKDMDANIFRFRCKENCKNVINVPMDVEDIIVKCESCSNHINILKGLKVLQNTESIFRLGKSLMSEGKTKQALKKFMELIRILEDILVPPFKDYHICQQAIRTCFLAVGNRKD